MMNVQNMEERKQQSMTGQKKKGQVDVNAHWHREAEKVRDE